MDREHRIAVIRMVMAIALATKMASQRRSVRSRISVNYQRQRCWIAGQISPKAKYALFSLPLL